MLGSDEYYCHFSLEGKQLYILSFMLIYLFYANIAYSLAQSNTMSHKMQQELAEVDDYLSHIEEEYDVDNTINDPLEPINRLIFNANEGIDWLILRPSAKLYNKYIPRYGRDRIETLLRNLLEPLNIIFHILSLNIKGVSISSARFAINAVFGIAGFYDIASTRWNMTTNTVITGSDILGKYGIPKGPYFVLPILGPASLRSTIGLTLDYYADPFNIWCMKQAIWTRGIATVIHYRAKVLSLTEAMSKNALDKYSYTRSMYLQYQQHKTKN